MADIFKVRFQPMFLVQLHPLSPLPFHPSPSSIWNVLPKFLLTFDDDFFGETFPDPLRQSQLCSSQTHASHSPSLHGSMLQNFGGSC